MAPSPNRGDDGAFRTLLLGRLDRPDSVAMPLPLQPLLQMRMPERKLREEARCPTEWHPPPLPYRDTLPTVALPAFAAAAMIMVNHPLVDGAGMTGFTPFPTHPRVY